MANALLNRLSDKVRLALAEIHALRKDKERLEAELTLMGEENRRARRLIREHEELTAERERLRARVEKVVDKMNRLRL